MTVTKSSGPLETCEDINDGRRHEFRFPSASRDLVRRILAGETYPTNLCNVPVSTVFDVGASTGAATLYFRAAYPDAVIWAFEPHGESFAVLESNLRPLSGVKARNVGLWDRDATRVLHVGRLTPVTGSIGRSALNTEAGESVRLVAADAFAQAQGISRIDILKVDTEGCEVPILQSLLPRFRPAVVHLEFHSEADRRRIDDLLGEDYVLARGAVPHPHRGEMSYVRADAVPLKYRNLAILPADGQ